MYVPGCWVMCSLDAEQLVTEVKCVGGGLVVGSYVPA